MSLTRRSRLLRGAITSVAALLVVAAPLAAQAKPKARSAAASTAAPKAVKGASVEGITEYALPNGMKVLLFPDQSKPTVTVNITYLVGSRHEGFGETGMAHLLEHMVFKGSKHHADMAAEFTNHGARRNGSTFYDRTNYFETVPASDANLAWALDLEADRMVNSFIAKKDLESEFSVVRNELESGENSSFRVLWQRVFRAAFQWHNYGRNTIGSRSDIEGVPVERLQMFYRKYYQPDNAVLIVAGKFDPEKTLAVVEKKFGTIPRPKRTLAAGNLLFPSYTIEPPQDGERFVRVNRVGDANMLMMGFHVPAGSHPDAAALDVLGEALTSAPAGRLYKALVDTKLAASVYIIPDFLHFRDPGVFLLLSEVRTNQNLDSARAGMEQALAASHTTAFTTEEVDRAKTTLLKNFDLALNSSDQSAINLSEWMAMGDWRLWFLHRDRIASVTPADVQRVAAAYLKPDNRTTGFFVATAQPDRAEIPETPSVAALVADYKGKAVVQAGEAFDASPGNIDTRTKRTELPNGMHVQLLPKRTRGASVNGQIVLRYGSEASLMNKGEIPSLTSAMLSRGTKTLTRQQVQDSLDKLKAQVFIGGGVNNTVVSFETTSPNVVPLLDLIAQQLRSPRFDPEELDKLKKEQLAQVEAAKSQPQFLAGIALQRAIMPEPKGHPMYTATADETIADINAATVGDLRAFHDTFFGASAADMSIVGDFDDAAVSAAAARLFGDWKNPQPYERLKRTYVKSDSTLQSIETPDKPNAMFLAAQTLALKDDAPDYAAFALANYILGGSGMSSRITTRLRQQEGLSYGAGSQLSVQSLDPYGVWTAYAIYAPQNIQRLQTAFREEIDRALKEGFTAKEIDQWRVGYLQGRSQSRANDNELANLLVSRRYAGRTMAYDENLEKQIQALTPDQVNAALRKYIDPQQIVIVRAGDFAKNPPTKATP